MLEDRLLVWKLIRGDTQSLRRIYNKHKDALLSIAISLLNEAGAAEDVLHDVFVSFAEGIKHFHLYGSLKNYLITCVVNLVYDRFRERMYRVVGLDSTGPIRPTSDSTKQLAMDSEESQFVADALVQLPDQQRNAIILHLLGSMKFREIARMQSVSVDAVQGRYRYGLDKLRTLLDAKAKPLYDIEESVRKLRCTTTAETDERILDDALAALAELIPSRPTGWLNLCEIILKSRTAAFAAAVIIVSALIGVVVFIGQGQKQQPQITPQIEPPQTESTVGTVKKPKPAPTIETTQPVPELELELQRIERIFAAGDVNGLVVVLNEEAFVNKLAAAILLAKIGDLRAIETLEGLSTDYGGSDANNPFAVAAREIKSRLEKEKQQAESRTAAETKDEQENIHGWLIDANDNPVRGQVSLGGVKVRTAEDGAFTVRRPTSTEFSSVFGQAFNTKLDLGCLFIWGKSYDANNAEIIVKPPASVSGFVVDRSGNPVEDFELEISVLVKDDAVYQGSLGEVPWKTEIAADGSFDINSVPTGVGLQLAVKKSDFETTIKLQGLSAGRNLDIGRITLEQVKGLDEIARWDCVLTGFVVNEHNEPVGGVAITAGVGEEHFEITSDASGRYEFQGLPEGVQMEIEPYSDSYGYNPFAYICSELSNELDIQMFPPAYDWYDKPAPGLFVEKLLNGEAFGLEELRGRVVLLQVGIDLAGYPQQTEVLTYLRYLEQIKDIIERYGDSGLAVIGVHKRLDTQLSEDDIRQFITEYDINFPFCIDEAMDVVRDMMLPEERFREAGRIGVPRRGLRSEGAMYSLYEVKAQPAYYLIDKDGILRISPAASELEDWLEQLLAE
ncbi:MAG: sigma-70 family RNA polymerase sigma factor [Planctomycetota bacterium]|jgi:RNA polymerase sigma-70 factor (ECF subfamily)